MARRTSLLVAVATLSGIAGCSAANPTTTRHIAWAQQQQNAVPQQQQNAVPQQYVAPQQNVAPQPYLNDQGNNAQMTIPTTQLGQTGIGDLGAGMPVPTTPLVAGAMAIPPLGALAGGLSGPLPLTALSSLEAFPTLAFAPFRYIDLYTPLFSTSFRVAAATLGLPSGLPLSIFSRLNFFGVNSNFGFYAPMYWWHGAFQPLSIYNSLNANFTYPYLYSGPAGVSPFYYSSPSLLSQYSAPLGACSVCAPSSALGINP